MPATARSLLLRSQLGQQLIHPCSIVLQFLARGCHFLAELGAVGGDSIQIQAPAWLQILIPCGNRNHPFHTCPVGGMAGIAAKTCSW
jgi:hypothetical protein